MENQTLSPGDLFAGFPTPAEFAAAYNKEPRTVYRWIARGDLVTVTVMGKQRIDLRASRERLEGLAAKQAPRGRGRPSKQAA